MKIVNKSQFARLEQRIEQLVEGGFARLFAGRLHPREVAVHLARAMEDGSHRVPDGGLYCPNVFTVALNPLDHAALTEAQPSLAESLAEVVIDLASRAEMRLITTPIIHLRADEQVPLRAIQVTGHHEAEKKSTQSLAAVNIPEPDLSRRNPQLVLFGTHHIPLDRHIINIGRRPDNHVVIEDTRVSRTHAQIRLRFGHYVIYDLGSLGGTFVNDHRITESILKPGDVISLAGVMMVYLEDDRTGDSKPDTSSKITDTQIRPVNNRREADHDSDQDPDPTL